MGVPIHTSRTGSVWRWKSGVSLDFDKLVHGYIIIDIGTRMYQRKHLKERQSAEHIAGEEPRPKAVSQSPEATTNPNGPGGDNMRNTKKVIAATAAASNTASATSRYNKGLD